MRALIYRQAFLFQGYYCDMTLANVSQLRPCPKGHYCPAGTALPDQHPCPIGTFNPRQRTHSLADCVPCAAGNYCPSVGLSEPAGEKDCFLFSFNFYLCGFHHFFQQLVVLLCINDEKSSIFFTLSHIIL